MRRRQGFTLIELMVSMALIVFIMSILSGAFAAATKSFRDLKAANEMAEKLHTAGQLLRRDLSSDHFAGRERLSSLNFWKNGPPPAGFFRIYQGSPVGAGLNVQEGADVNGIPSYRSYDHMLHFTVKSRGNLRSDYFTASVPGGSPLLNANIAPGLPEARYVDSANVYSYQWAEVAWFLRQLPDNANGTPLWALYRRQRAAVYDNAAVTLANGGNPVPVAQLNNYLEVSCNPDPNNPANLYFNSPIDLTIPNRRLQMLSAGPPNPVYQTFADQGAPANMLAADLVLSDVLSFDVRVLLDATDGGVTFVDLNDPTVQAFANGNPAFTAANGPRVFDTWSSVPGVRNPPGAVPDYSQWNQPNLATSIPLWSTAKNRGPVIRAIQITIRVWDSKTETARQITIVQDM